MYHWISLRSRGNPADYGICFIDGQRLLSAKWGASYSLSLFKGDAALQGWILFPVATEVYL